MCVCSTCGNAQMKAESIVMWGDMCEVNEPWASKHACSQVKLVDQNRGFWIVAPLTTWDVVQLMD